MMDRLLYAVAWLFVKVIQALPLGFLARLGRAAGAVTYWLDAPHRRTALMNLAIAFGREKSAAERQAIARENFRRLGENYLCALKTAGMSLAEVQRYCAFDDLAQVTGRVSGG